MNVAEPAVKNQVDACSSFTKSHSLAIQSVRTLKKHQQRHICADKGCLRLTVLKYSGCSSYLRFAVVAILGNIHFVTRGNTDSAQS